MREKLNSNPMLQAAVIGVLLLGTAFFLLSTMGGGGEEEAEAPAETATTSTLEVGTGEEASAATVADALASVGDAATAAPPPPAPVIEAWDANKTIVLLFVRNGGIDDRLVRTAAEGLRLVPDVATFTVPAREISRYAAIAEGVGVERTPALVVVSPKDLDKSVPTASVHYGFQHPQSVVQAVIDAGYQGRTVDYHP